MHVDERQRVILAQGERESGGARAPDAVALKVEHFERRIVFQRVGDRRTARVADEVVAEPDAANNRCGEKTSVNLKHE